MKMSFKILCAAVVVVVMLMSVLFGCGGTATKENGENTQTQVVSEKTTSDDQSPAKDVELTFMGWQPDLSVLNESMIPLLNEKYPNIKIKPQILEWFAYWDKLTIETAAGAGPDIAAMDVDHIPKYNDYMEPLGDLASEVIGNDWQSKYTDGIIDSLKVVDDSVKMLPSDTTGLWYLFYNKSLCDELNVAAPTGDYADLVSFVSNVNAAGKDLLAMAFAGKEDVNVGFF